MSFSIQYVPSFGNRSKNGKMWEQLTEEQRNQVLLAFEESEEDYNLIDQKNAFKR